MENMNNERRGAITLGGGCFWCLEAAFEELRGVTHVMSGYAGGHVPHPTYREVCAKNTGHAEVVQVTFDLQQISLRDLLDVFFTIHDPTTRDRQGADVGPQYRSIILLHSDEQRRIAESVIAELEERKVWDAPIVTEIKPLERFYRAEAEHEQYYRRNQSQPYCQMVIEPKIAKLRSRHLEKLRKS
jgi:peptide-methionine (S)-S-oxide reductase